MNVSETSYSFKDIVNPQHTALLVFDTQTGLVDSIFNRAEFLLNLKSLITAARTNNISVSYSRVTAPPKGYEADWRKYILFKRYSVDNMEKIPKIFDLTSPESQIYPDIGPLENEIIIFKSTPSLFVGTNFEKLMRDRSIKTIIFTGIATEIGIAASAIDASNREFFTVVVQDCVSSFNRGMHEWALKALGNFGLVIPSTQIMAEWKQ